MIDDSDRRLIVATQAGLPLMPRPYHVLAETLGMTVDEVLARLEAMLKLGVIRRIGAVPNHYALGYRNNGMTVWDVDDLQVDTLGSQVGALPFVTHCYRRPRRLPDWPFNLFAMVHCKTREEASERIAEIAALLGPACRCHDTLFSSRILKKTGMRIQA
jgi:DNA-binding Lrp family transcriptional regulator